MTHGYMNMVGRKTTCLVVFVALLVCLTTKATQAGFEWVPATAETPAVEQKAPATEDAAFMPEPIVQSEPLQPAFSSPDQEAVQPLVQQSTVQNLADQAPAELLDTPSGETKLKVLAVTQPGQPSTEEAAPQKTKVLVLPTVKAREGFAPPPSSRIIVPEDAPESAMTIMPDNNEGFLNTPTASGQETAEERPLALQQEIPALVHTTAPQATTNFTEAVGFGNDTPLAIALQQVVPPEYTFSFGTDVNPGSRVSWNGGKPWNEVVSDMVDPLSLRVNIKDRIVHIHKSEMSGDISVSVQTD